MATDLDLWLWDKAAEPEVLYFGNMRTSTGRLHRDVGR